MLDVLAVAVTHLDQEHAVGHKGIYLDSHMYYYNNVATCHFSWLLHLLTYQQH